MSRLGRPNPGRWSLPGGAVERGETIRAAVVREMREEVGLIVEPLEIVDVVDIILPPRRPKYHYVAVVFRLRALRGTPRAGSDAGAIRWVSRPDLATLDVTETTRAILERVLP